MRHVDDVLKTLSQHAQAQLALPAHLEDLPLGKPESMLFVDGGNGELLPGNACTVVLVKVCGLLYQQRLRKRFTEQYYCICSLSENGVHVQTFPKSCCDGKTLEGDLPGVANTVRRLLELSFAKEHAEEVIAVCLDGSFDTASKEEEASLSELKMRAPCISFSKTCSLTHKGFYITILAEHEAARAERCLIPWKNTYLVKLHPRASHVFRVDVAGDARSLLGALAAYASDPSFFGYPYPLILADKYAKVTQQDIAAQQALFASRAGMSWQSLKKAMTGMNAHTIIDKINKNG